MLNDSRPASSIATVSYKDVYFRNGSCGIWPKPKQSSNIFWSHPYTAVLTQVKDHKKQPVSKQPVSYWVLNSEISPVFEIPPSSALNTTKTTCFQAKWRSMMSVAPDDEGQQVTIDTTFRIDRLKAGEEKHKDITPSNMPWFFPYMGKRLPIELQICSTILETSPSTIT